MRGRELRPSAKTRTRRPPTERHAAKAFHAEVVMLRSKKLIVLLAATAIALPACGGLQQAGISPPGPTPPPVPKFVYAANSVSNNVSAYTES
jgi:hypothetical protein